MFDKLVWLGVDEGQQGQYTFENGYSASVIDFGYGSEKGLFELAVLDTDGEITYDTPVTGDVEGWLTPEMVSDLMKQVEAL